MFGLACALPTAAAAGPATPAERTKGKRVRAERVDRGPRIDGRLDDAVWKRAEFVGDFAEKTPVEGAKPTRRTEVAILYDAKALYVGARMQADGPADVRAIMTRRDDSGSAERIIVSFDTFRDRRTAYSFALTAAGVRVDWIHTSDSEGARDHSWDPVWQGRVHVDDTGWSAEMKIPFSQLRFPSRTEQIWGVNFNRYMPQSNEDVFWVVVPKDQTAWSSYFGELVGISDIEPSRRLEIMPYVAADLTQTSASLVDPDDPFASELAPGARAGVDLKMGLGPSLTLDATINPDFGQVEADPAVVNLSAFESVFSERRPFFTEGSQLFAGSGPVYFYSRRIGQAPRGSVDGDFTDIPTSTPILGAAKVTGRLQSGLSVGALSAVTGKAHAETYDLGEDRRERVAIEPLTGYGVLRLQQEVGREASVVGVTLTGVRRHLDETVLADSRARQAYTGGLDWDLRFGGNAYLVSGYAGFSAIGGREAAIAALQESSAHYFQRPDQDHVDLDLDRNWLRGLSSSLTLSKQTGSWIGHLFGRAETPGFDLNDVGQLYSGDELSLGGSLRYRDVTPGQVLRYWDFGTSLWEEWNFGGVRRPGSVSTSGGVEWTNFWGTGFVVDYALPGLDDWATRGGPLMERGQGWGFGVNGRGNYNARTYWTGHIYVSRSETDSSGFEVYGGLVLHPSDRWKLTVSPHLRSFTTHRQYIDTIAGAVPDTFGQRYIFAQVDRSELAAQVRFEYAFTPTLSLSFYGEPFAASGEFSGYGELPAPRSQTLRVYGTDGTTIAETEDGLRVTDGAEVFDIEPPDFTFLSLRSTCVVRWEFLPGSVLYAVWQQNRAEDLSLGSRAGPGDFADTFGAPGSHIFAVKVSYWWSLD